MAAINEKVVLIRLIRQVPLYYILYYNVLYSVIYYITEYYPSNHGGVH